MHTPTGASKNWYFGPLLALLAAVLAGALVHLAVGNGARMPWAAIAAGVAAALVVALRDRKRRETGRRVEELITSLPPSPSAAWTA